MNAPRHVAETAALACAAPQGDRLGLGVLLERHRPRLYAAALSILHVPAEAQDAVHETFLSALLHLGQVRDPMLLPAPAPGSPNTRLHIHFARSAPARDEGEP